jgi:predicted amidophosphoribosyltransferase
MLFELNNLRGYRMCPKCDAEVNGKFQFCGVCGAKLPSIEDAEFADNLQANDYYTETSNDFYDAGTK